MAEPQSQFVSEPDENGTKFAMIRRSAYKMQADGPLWFLGLQITKILSHAQSESDGNVTISIFYR